MRSDLLWALAATSALISTLGGGAALAACQPGTGAVASGNAVVCSGVETAGFDAGAATNLTITVLPGASVIAPAFLSGLQLTSGNTVTNSGTVVALGLVNRGIELTGTGNLVINNGLMVAAGQTSWGILSTINAGGTIINAGTIIASGAGARGISALAATSIVNSGLIVASGASATGVEVQDESFTNSGVVQATGADATALQPSGNAGNAIFNAAGGLIFGDAGVGARAIDDQSGATTIVNAGTIDGVIRSQSGLPPTIVNAGLITISTGALGQGSTIGAFTQTAAGTLALRVGPTGAHDTMEVLYLSPIALAGTLRAVVQPGLYNTVTVYNAVFGGEGWAADTRFATVASSSIFFSAAATYVPAPDIVDQGFVSLTLTRIPFNAVPGETQNQQALATVLESLYSPNATGAAATIFGTLLAAGSLSVLDGLSGEAGTGPQNPSFAMGDAFFGALAGQMQRWRDGAAAGGGAGTQSAGGVYRVQFAAAQPAFELAGQYAQAAAAGTGAWPPRAVGRPSSAWASGFGLSGSRSGDGGVGSGTLHYSMGGGAAGFDVQLAPNLLGGLAVAGAGSDFSIDGRSANGTARTIFFGAYGSWTMGALYVDAALNYGHGQFSTARIATLGGLAERATGDFDGNQYGARLEVGWRVALNRYAVTPFAAVTVQSLHQDGYSETSINTATNATGILGLSYRPQTTTSVRSFLGAAAATTVQLGERTSLTPRVRIAWAHEFNADRQVDAAFLSIPGAAFTVTGARPARDSAVISAGLDIGFGRMVTLFAQFDGDISAGGNAYAGSGGLRVSW